MDPKKGDSDRLDPLYLPLRVTVQGERREVGVPSLMLCMRISSISGPVDWISLYDALSLFVRNWMKPHLTLSKCCNLVRNCQVNQSAIVYHFKWGLGYTGPLDVYLPESRKSNETAKKILQVNDFASAIAKII